MKLHHVGILCSDADRDSIIRVLELLGYHYSIGKKVPEFQCYCYMIGSVELVVPYDGKLLDRLNSVGLSIHHFALKVDSLASTEKVLRMMDVKLVCDSPVSGAGDIWVNFIHPSNCGIMIELVEVPYDN